MIEPVALAIVMVTGIFFLSLGGASLVAPARASRFLLGFAGSPSKHYAELVVRLLVGVAFELAPPRAFAHVALTLFGWLLLVTTAGLLIIPWHWHHRFAGRAVPEALRFLPIVGIASVALGALVLWAVARGSA